jgi:hypothetical protein
MQKRRAIYRGRAPFSLLAVLLGLAGCGGTAGDTQVATATKSDLVARANAICENTDKVQAAAFRVYQRSHSRKELEGRAGEERIVLKVGLPAIAVEIKELRDLEVPVSQKKKIDEIWSAAETALRKAEATPSLIFKPSTDPFVPVEKMSEGYGMKACGLT